MLFHTDIRGDNLDIKIVDTTLRDGEQKAGIALGVADKVLIAKMLDTLGIYQIEAGIPAMGGSEKKSIFKIMDLNLKSRISVWNRMNIEDIKHSLECKPDIIHISVPVSDIQIKLKLGMDRSTLIEYMRRCICFALNKNSLVTVGMEDASRADFEFMLNVISVAKAEGIETIRYADTVGILYRQRIFKEIQEIRRQVGVNVDFHGHNDLGMAVANSISAARAGARYIDCTIGGIGERAGNCSYYQFVYSAQKCIGAFKNIDIDEIMRVELKILKIMEA